MGYIEGISREQIILFPEVIDDYIEEDNPVQFIDAFVDNPALVELNTNVIIYDTPLPSLPLKGRGLGWG